MGKIYVCKATSSGRVTLPNEMRKKLEIGKDDYIIIQRIGDTYFIRKVEAERDLLEKVRKKIKKSGITREKLDRIIEEAREEVWRKSNYSTINS